MIRRRLLAIPRLWWLPLASITTLTVLITIVVIGTRLTDTDYNCLYLDGDDIGMLDITTGKYFSYPSWNPETALPETKLDTPYALSPDGKRVAYFKDIAAGELVVQHFKKPVPNDMQYMFYSFNDGRLTDISWSPDGRFIGYRWRIGTKPDTQDNVAVADANGNLIHQIRLDNALGDPIIFDSWSPDDKYVALRRILGDSNSMLFLSVPELQIVDGSVNAHRANVNCTFNGYRQPDCPLWAANKQTAAYVSTDKDANPYLVINAPELAEPRIFDLPDSSIPTIQSSPNGDFVAVASFIWGADHSAKDAQIDIFGIDGTINSNIGRAMEYIDEEAMWVFARMQWSPDGKSLIYERLNSTDNKSFDIARYQVDTGQTSILLHVPDDVFTGVYIAPDSQSSVVYITNGKFYLVSIDGNIIAHFQTTRLPVDNIIWSPDSKMFVYRDNDPAVHRGFLNIVSNTGEQLGRFYDGPYIRKVTWTRCDAP